MFWNLTFCKPGVLKPNVLKPDVLKPDVLKPDVLWVYPVRYRFFKWSAPRLCMSAAASKYCIPAARLQLSSSCQSCCHFHTAFASFLNRANHDLHQLSWARRLSVVSTNSLTAAAHFHTACFSKLSSQSKSWPPHLSRARRWIVPTLYPTASAVNW